MEEYKEENINFYNKNIEKLAQKFKDFSGLEHRYEFEMFCKVIPGKKVLDVGCGTGDHMEYFVTKGLDVNGIDIAEEMVNHCKQKRLNAELMDIENITLRDNQFDGIWAVTSLVHIPKEKLPIVISKLHSLLKEKGILYVCLIEGPDEGFIADGVENTKRFFSFFTKEEMLGLFSPEFKLLDFQRVSFRHYNFLQGFFRK